MTQERRYPGDHEAVPGVIKVAFELCGYYEWMRPDWQAKVKTALEALKPLILDDQVIAMIDYEFQEALDGNGWKEILDRIVAQRAL